MPVTDAPLVRATLRALDGDKLADRKHRSTAATYVLAVRDGKVSVGHNMCSGAFDLAQSTRYLVRLEAIGASGVVVPPTFDRELVIVGPTPQWR